MYTKDTLTKEVQDFGRHSEYLLSAVACGTVLSDQDREVIAYYLADIPRKIQIQFT